MRIAFKRKIIHEIHGESPGETGCIHGIGFTDPVIITELDHEMIIGAVRQIQGSISWFILFIFGRIVLVGVVASVFIG